MDYYGNGYKMKDGKLFVDSEYYIRYMQQALSSIRSGMYFEKRRIIIENIENNDTIYTKLKEQANNCYELYEAQEKIIFGSNNTSKSERNANPTLYDSWSEYQKCENKCEKYIKDHFEENPIQIDEEKAWKEFKDMEQYDMFGSDYEKYKHRLLKYGIESSDDSGYSWYQI